MVSAFNKILHEGSIWNGPIAVLSFILHKSIFLHFVHHSTNVYDKYINNYDRRKYIDDYGSGIFPKNRGRKLYNKKYQETYGNRSYVVSSPYIKDIIMQRVYSGIKWKATGLVYI